MLGPLRSIHEAVPGKLADLSFVVLQRTKRSKLNQLPYLGPAWYARLSVERMLHVGLASWEDITFSLHASAHVPPECLGQVHDIMEAATPEVFPERSHWPLGHPGAIPLQRSHFTAPRIAWATT